MLITSIFWQSVFVMWCIWKTLRVLAFFMRWEAHYPKYHFHVQPHNLATLLFGMQLLIHRLASCICHILSGSGPLNYGYELQLVYNQACTRLRCTHWVTAITLVVGSTLLTRFLLLFVLHYELLAYHFRASKNHTNIHMKSRRHIYIVLTLI